MFIQQTLEIKSLSTEKLIGNEEYKTIGRMLSAEEVKEIFKLFKGLMRSGNCLRKACIVRDWLKKEREDAFCVQVGSAYVIDHINHSSFGHEHNPPFEYHAWVYGYKDKSVYDLALPGLIERGAIAEDEYGKILVNVEPIILATGSTRIPLHVRYKAYTLYSGDGKEEHIP